jgi:hypothetical protein
VIAGPTTFVRGRGAYGKRLPVALYPIAPLLAYVVTIWSEAAIHPTHLVRPTVVAVALGLAIVGITRIAAGERRLGGIAALAICVSLLVTNVALALPLLALAGLIVLLARLQRRSIPIVLSLTGLLNVLGAAMLVVATITVMISAATMRSPPGDLGEAIDVAPGTNAPDIFMVLLDGYPGPAASAAAPWFDRSAFPDALRDRGFEVVEGSRASYTWTLPTMASMFAMRHLHPGDDDRRILHQLIEHGAASDVLDRAGYRTISVSSGFTAADMHSADRLLLAPQPNDLEIGIFRSTLLGKMIEEFAPGTFSALHRSRIEWTFRSLDVLAAEAVEAPRFVFVHVPAPHAPWVFGPNGEPRDEGLSGFYTDAPAHRGISRSDAVRRSFDQAAHIADLTVATIDRIAASLGDDAIVVVFSDHGPRMHLDDSNPFLGLDIRASNFTAIRTPGRSNVLPPGTTPVNLLPRIFNTVLGTSIEPMPDTTFAWQEGENLPDMLPADRERPDGP